MDGNAFSGEKVAAEKMSGRLGDRPPRIQLYAALLISFVLYIAVNLITGLLIRVYYGTDAEIISHDINEFLTSHGGDLNFFRFLQMASTTFIFGLGALLISKLITGSAAGLFRASRKANVRSLAYIPVMMMLTFPVILMVYDYTSRIPVPEDFVEMEQNMELLTKGLLSNPAMGIFLLNFLMIAILPAIFEELLFRGAIQELFARSSGNAHVAILFTGLLFGIIHGQVFKFLPIAVLGILLGYIYWWTRNIWFSIFAHFFYNGIQVVLYFLVSRGKIEMDLESSEMLPPLQTAIYTFFFAWIVYMFYRSNQIGADESR